MQYQGLILFHLLVQVTKGGTSDIVGIVVGMVTPNRTVMRNATTILIKFKVKVRIFRGGRVVSWPSGSVSFKR
jgi:hypothetical protein